MEFEKADLLGIRAEWKLLLKQEGHFIGTLQRLEGPFGRMAVECNKPRLEKQEDTPSYVHC